MDAPDGEPKASTAPAKAPKGITVCTQSTPGATKFKEISFSLERDETISDQRCPVRFLHLAPLLFLRR
ncbi:MAG: hypothetical protein WCG61_06700, partial [Chlorobium sp.]